MLDYLSRNTHRTAIGNERVKALTPDEVVFTVRADAEVEVKKSKVLTSLFSQKTWSHKKGVAQNRVTLFRVAIG